jgi:hypothetical protein
MRCTKCGYVSFDYLDRCKSCGEDLVPAKIKLNIYTKPPQIDINDEGFAVGKVGEDQKNLLEQGASKKQGTVSMEDVLKEDGEKLESFSFEDENS